MIRPLLPRENMRPIPMLGIPRQSFALYLSQIMAYDSSAKKGSKVECLNEVGLVLVACERFSTNTDDLSAFLRN